MLAAYIAKSGRRYTDDTHAGCLFQATDHESECAEFPHGAYDVGDLESRMGFVDAHGKFWTRDETLSRFGFELAEDVDRARGLDAYENSMVPLDHD